MMKKTTLTFTLIILISVTGLMGSVRAEAAFSGSPAITGDIELTDVSGHWAEVYITKMMLKKVAFGFADSTFHPDSPVTRLDVATMLVRLFGYMDPEEVSSPGSKPGFTDIASLPQEQQAYISLAGRLMLMHGDGGSGTFRPSDPVKRQEAAITIARVLGLDGPESPELNFADRAKIPDWAKGAVAVAVNAGLLTGYNDNTFRPERPLTRGEMAALLSRLDDRISDPGDDVQYYGTVLAVKTQGSEALNVKLSNGVMKNFKVRSEAKVFKGYGRTELKDVAAGDTVNVLTDKTGAIIFLKNAGELPESQVMRVAGRVVFAGKNGDMFTVSPVDGRGRNIKVKMGDAGAGVSVGLNDDVVVIGELENEQLKAVKVFVQE